MLVRLTMRRSPPKAPDLSPVEGIRILGLLPQNWQKSLERAIGDIVLLVHANGTTVDRIKAEVTKVLTDPAIGHWKITACETLAEKSHEPKEENQ